MLDSGGNFQNRDWQIYVSLVEQYAEHFQDSDTYSLTLTADSRFRPVVHHGRAWGVEAH